MRNPSDGDPRAHSMVIGESGRPVLDFMNSKAPRLLPRLIMASRILIHTQEKLYLCQIEERVVYVELCSHDP